LNKDPEARRLAGLKLRYSISKGWALFLTGAKLTSAQITRFQDILVADSLATLKWRAGSRGQAIFSSGTFWTPSREARELLSECLGAVAFQTYEALNSDPKSIWHVGELADSSLLSDEPLSAEHALHLALALTSKRSAVDERTGIRYEEPDWDGAIKKAGDILSPNQVSLFRTIAEREHAERLETLRKRS
jgi:hypothetical protein